MILTHLDNLLLALKNFIIKTIKRVRITIQKLIILTSTSDF